MIRLTLLACFLIYAVGLDAQSTLTAQQIIDRIQQHAGGPWQGPTVDTIKAGDPATPVTGIATTFTDTYEMLERASKAGLNLVISHEPTFYNHQDETKAIADDAVYRAKVDFITQHHMVVFRFHDHWHHPTMKPDGILAGMIHRLGWESFQNKENEMLFAIPQSTLAALASSVQDKLGARTLRVVGDRTIPVRNVAFLPGAAGSERQIAALERPDVEVLIVGESREWETVEYTRDASAQGKHKALIVIGHDLSEEAGMDNCATWLKHFLPDLPITFVPAGEPFWTPASR